MCTSCTVPDGGGGGEDAIGTGGGGGGEAADGADLDLDVDAIRAFVADYRAGSLLRDLTRAAAASGASGASTRALPATRTSGS